MFYIAVFVDFGRVQFLYANFSISIVRKKKKKVGFNITPKEFKHLRNDADVLSAFFIDHEKEVENLNVV